MNNASASYPYPAHLTVTDDEIDAMYTDVFALRAAARAAIVFFKGTPLEGIFCAVLEHTSRLRVDLEVIYNAPGRKPDNLPVRKAH